MVESTINPPLDGSGTPILVVRPDWSARWRETYEYLTDITQSAQGSEQRRAARFSPRRTFEFSLKMAGRDKVYLDQFMVRALSREILCPDHHRWITFTMDMGLEPVGQDDDGNPVYLTIKELSYSSPIPALAEGAPPYWVLPGMTVLLVDGTRCETRTVAGISAEEIQFTDGSQNTFPAGTRVYPAVRGYINPSPSAPRRTNRVATVDITYNISGGESFPNYPLPIDYASGKEVWMKRPNWAQAPEVVFIDPMNELDYTYGVVDRTRQFDWPSRTVKFSYVGRDHGDTLASIQFFMRQYGRRGSFFLPTWEDDILFSAMAGNGLSILIDGLDFGLAYKGSTVFKRIMLRMADGRYIHLAVDYVELLPDTNTSVLWLKDRLPDEVLTNDTVRGISWVLNVRSGTDRLEVEWLTHTVSQYSMSFSVLENNEA